MSAVLVPVGSETDRYRGRPPQRAARGRRRAAALMLAMIAVIVAGTVAYSYDFSSSGRLHITIANSVVDGFSSSWNWTLLAISGRLNLYATVGSNTLSPDWKN